VRTTGGIGLVCVYMPEDLGGAGEQAKQGRVGFAYGMFFTKGQHMGTGQAQVMRYNRQLRDLIVEGRATPSFLVSHELELGQGAGGYDQSTSATTAGPRCCSTPDPGTGWHDARAHRQSGTGQGRNGSVDSTSCGDSLADWPVTLSMTTAATSCRALPSCCAPARRMA